MLPAAHLLADHLAGTSKPLEAIAALYTHSSQTGAVGEMATTYSLALLLVPGASRDPQPGQLPASLSLGLPNHPAGDKGQEKP